MTGLKALEVLKAVEGLLVSMNGHGLAWSSNPSGLSLSTVERHEADADLGSVWPPKPPKV